jgi:hypothetical protein
VKRAGYLRTSRIISYVKKEWRSIDKFIFILLQHYLTYVAQTAPT